VERDRRAAAQAGPCGSLTYLPNRRKGQMMSDEFHEPKGSAVPRGRLMRAGRMCGLGAGLVGRAALSGMAELARGRRPRLSDLMLTPANVTRVTDQLAQMRGAAMKMGQLLSMEAGDILPPELSDILSRLRADAHMMPPQQLKQVLTAAYGRDFLKRFQRFDVRPIAAASIGQVHRAVDRDGRDLALKVQYPGVRDSIDSDVANVAALIRLSGMLPRHMDMAPLMEEARRQLHEEADYAREAHYLGRFGDVLSGDDRFAVPAVAHDLTTPEVLAMTFLAGDPIETVADAPQADRDRVVTALIDLTLAELFGFRMMQTDANFANYRYDPATGRIILLDFGATREFGPDLSDGYLDLLRAGLAGDTAAVQRQMEVIGFIRPGLDPAQIGVIMDMAEMGFAPLRDPDGFDFKGNDLADRLRRRGMAIGNDQALWHIPPADTLFLQRKLGGLYLLATRIGAKVHVRGLIDAYL